MPQQLNQQVNQKHVELKPALKPKRVQIKDYLNIAPQAANPVSGQAACKPGKRFGL